MNRDKDMGKDLLVLIHVADHIMKTKTRPTPLLSFIITWENWKLGGGGTSDSFCKKMLARQGKLPLGCNEMT